MIVLEDVRSRRQAISWLGVRMGNWGDNDDFGLTR